VNEALAGEDAFALLEALLGNSGVNYRRTENGEIRFLLLDSGRRWETVCRIQASTALFYGVYPFGFEEADRGGVVVLSDEINGKLVRGAVFFREGKVIVRTSAELFDTYTAYETAVRALEYNAGVVTAFWPRFAALQRA
jgi:hypothetical protein